MWKYISRRTKVNYNIDLKLIDNRSIKSILSTEWSKGQLTQLVNVIPAEDYTSIVENTDAEKYFNKFFEI